MKHISIKIFLILILGLFSSISVLSDNDEHNILVLHSYHQGLEWTDSISSGIQSVFSDRNDVNLIFEYLDIKRNFNEDYYNVLYDLYSVKAKQVPFEAIIISDNAAYDFMMVYGQEFYPDIPVLFCGINNLDTTELKKYPNFRGIGERADHNGTIQSIIEVFPERKKVLVINDHTITGQAIKKELDLSIEKFSDRLSFEFVSDFTIPELRDKVKNLSDDYVIYLLVINRDKNGRFISYKEGISIIKETSRVPIFGSWDFYKGKGLFGGKITKGWEQGKQVALLAEQIIEGKSIEELPTFQYPESSYVFDYNEIVNYEKDISDLPCDSQIINHSNKNEEILRIFIIVVIVLIGLLSFLFIRLRVRRAREVEMERIISERTAQLNETNQKLSDIILSKDKFFSILAHDLRNSVNIFLNFSMLLNEKEVLEDQEQSALFRKKLQVSANQTYGLVEDLLYWGINQFTLNRKLEITKFQCSDVIENIIERYRINLNNVFFTINYKEGLIIESDINICQFIFRNIIQNAIKYSQENGEIRISTDLSNEFIQVSIEDDGIGMDQETIESIYNRTPIRKVGQNKEIPTGLGLSSVLDYLEQINGKLEIESTPHKGSVFRIVLPSKLK